MSETVSFRFWDTVEEVMIDWFAARQTAFNNSECQLMYRLFTDTRYLKLQCTGLKDKNSNLIFDGDLIRYPLNGAPVVRNALHVVKFWSTTASFVADRVDGEASFIHFYEPALSEVEVVGNIYEVSKQ